MALGEIALERMYIEEEQKHISSRIQWLQERWKRHLVSPPKRK